MTKTTPPAPKQDKIRIGWFSFSCCEDSTILMTELLNDHWQVWKELFDFRHFSVLKKNNILDRLDIAFVEGALASKGQVARVKEIRKKSKLVVAIGSCACMGLPSGQRNTFSPGQQAEIQFLIDRFGALPKVLKLTDVIAVDAEVPGCPMDPKIFLEVVDEAVAKIQAKR
ncbi:MAG: hypothetical protein V1821_00105 [bacterium]